MVKSSDTSASPPSYLPPKARILGSRRKGEGKTKKNEDKVNALKPNAMQTTVKEVSDDAEEGGKEKGKGKKTAEDVSLVPPSPPPPWLGLH